MMILQILCTVLAVAIVVAMALTPLVAEAL